MLYRIDILSGENKRVVCAYYKAGADILELQAFAESERSTLHADGYRLSDLHGALVTEVSAHASA